MYNIIPIVLIFAAVVTAVVIIARRLPDITAINTDSIPEARAAATKRRLMLGRLERKVQRALAASWKAAARAGTAVQSRSASVYDTLTVLERRYRAPEIQLAIPPTAPLAADALTVTKTKGAVSDGVAVLMEEADRDRAAKRYGEAERVYLEIIRREHRHAGAYRGLGLLYHEQRQFEEARQAFSHALRLEPSAAGHAALGNLCQEAGSLEEAFAEYQEALRIEPAVDYLDRLLEVCILLGNKSRAQEILARLEATAPEHSRLVEFQKRVSALPVRRKRNLVKT